MIGGSVLAVRVGHCLAVQVSGHRRLGSGQGQLMPAAVPDVHGAEGGVAGIQAAVMSPELAEGGIASPGFSSGHRDPLLRIMVA